MPKTIHLGFEIGSGEPVAIPLKHTVITGQTQEAGKTTTLEALISRSGLRALTFVTKRGEGSFRQAHTIAPYFREQADWQYVSSILEASRGEKLKFERAWIIRASEGAQTLAGVQRNVRRAMETAKGMSADVYLTLNAYLEVVVPQIACVKWAAKVELQQGVNVMDLHQLPDEMQHLVIKSSLDWIARHEENTVVVVPEAWKFIPQGRGTPVKLSCESFIRQSAGLGNYLWLDSQDIAGVEKIILKSVPLWVLGVQRESNEIKRTLAQIPAGTKKPKPEDIATLGLGQFIYCYGKHTIKTYVQPDWMTEVEARAVALGQTAITDRPAPAKRQPEPQSKPANPINESETDEMANSDEILAAVQETNTKIDKMVTAISKQAARPAELTATSPTPKAAGAAAKVPPFDESKGDDIEDLREEIYQRFLARLIRDIPAILEVIQELPEIRITVHRPVIEMDNKSITGKIALLLHDGFFDAGAMASAVQKHLEKNGMEFATSNPIYASLNELRELGAFTVTDPGGKKGKLYTRAEGLKFTKKTG